MKRYFYDCPIKAAYMVRYHGMKVHGPVRKPSGGIDTSARPMPVWILARAIEAAEKGMGPEDAKYYISADSMGLLEPRAGDLITWEYPTGEFRQRHSYEVLTDGNNHNHFPANAKRLIEETGAQIIQRGGVVFHWPENEDGHG